MAAPYIIAGVEIAATAATAYFAAHDAGTIAGTAMSSAPASYKNEVYNGIAENWGAGLSVASQLAPALAGEARAGATAEQKVFRAGGYEVKLNPSVTEPYARPSNATNLTQKSNVQGFTCTDCGTTGKMFADHKTPLMMEYYQTGKINLENMRSTSAVQPQCANCSAQQGAYLSNISKQIKSYLSSGK